MKKIFNKAFTLVELIVVITILAVLATVAFISFQGYTSSSRDSVRLADLKNISKSFEINRTKGIDFLLPDKKVDISSSGTIFQYQGELSQNILNSHLNIFDGGVDPLTGDNYGYAVNSARNKFQVIGFLENQDSVANISLNTTFADNSDKFPKTSGDTLGIILNESTNEVIVQSGSFLSLEIKNNNQKYGLILDENNFFRGTNELQNFDMLSKELFGSCLEILTSDNTLQNNDGYYPIKISGKKILVYCDMTYQGGGWTRTFYSDSNLFGYNIESADVLDIYDESIKGNNNFSILYGFSQLEHNDEFYIKDSAEDFIYFTQTNEYNQSPDNNNYTEIEKQYEYYPNFEDSGPNHGLFLGKFSPNTSVQNLCVLTNADFGQTWTNCLRDNHSSYGTGPWRHTSDSGYSSGAQKFVEIYQR